MLQPITGVSDARRLRRTHPDLAPADWQPQQSDLAEIHREYVETISVAGHAASLETVVYLDLLCRVLKPRRALDTGSGLSSYAIRRYCQETGAVSVSVDHSEEWLPKTRGFLEGKGISTDELILWEDFKARSWEPFDLVFHDLSGGELRNEAMPLVTGLVRDGGAIVYDDMQARKHRGLAWKTAGSMDTYSLRKWTLDEIGRYAMLAIN